MKTTDMATKTDCWKIGSILLGTSHSQWWGHTTSAVVIFCISFLSDKTLHRLHDGYLAGLPVVRCRWILFTILTCLCSCKLVIRIWYNQKRILAWYNQKRSLVLDHIQNNNSTEIHVYYNDGDTKCLRRCFNIGLVSSMSASIGVTGG